MSLTVPLFQAGQRHLIRLGKGVEMAFRYIPPGEFRMGSRYTEDWSLKTQEPVHRVRIAQGFWLGETPVTQVQFAVWTKAEVIEHKNEFTGQPDHPAENMGWSQATRFCRWLTVHAAGHLPAGTNYACLPTEAEWEYGCRAGTETEYHTGDGAAALAEVGRYGEAYVAGTRPVRQGVGNAFGLYDLHGHVWQWCHNVWGKDRDKPRPVYRQAIDSDADAAAVERAKDYADQAAAMLKDGHLRVFRGGSWGGPAGGCRSAYRYWWPPGSRYWFLGFRVCLAPGPADSNPPANEAGPGARDGGGGKPTESNAPGTARAVLSGDHWGGARLPAHTKKS